MDNANKIEDIAGEQKVVEKVHFGEKKSELGRAFHPEKVALINVISALKGLFTWRWGTPGR